MIPLTFLVLGALLVPAAPADGSEPHRAAAPDTLQLTGQLQVDGAPADTGTVTLHRVAPDEAGPVDSLSVGTEGRFRLTLPGPPREGTPGDEPPADDPGAEEALPGPPQPGAGDVYFASVRREGVLYYGAPLVSPEQLDDLYVIEAYSTMEAAAGGEPFSVARRQLLLQQGDGAWRATDILEVRNDRQRTVVGADATGTVWRHPLPEGARRFQVGEGDLPADQAVYEDGEVRISAPMTPGRRLFVFLYELPRLPAGVPLGAETDSLEVFVREPAPRLEVAGLERAEGVEVEPGTSFRRLVGSGLEAGVLAVEEVDEEGEGRTERLVVIITLVLAAAAIWLLLSSGRPEGRGRGAGTDAGGSGGGVHGGDPEVRSATAVMEEIAALDEAYAQGEGPPEGEYQERRRVLLDELRSGA